MAASPCVVLYGNSLFLAGIRAELVGHADFGLLTVAADYPDATGLIRELGPAAVVFDLAAGQPDFTVALLLERPGLLLVGLDPSSDQVLVLSCRRERAVAPADLLKIIDRETGNRERNEGK
jgi:hypothetical protein